MTQSWSLVSSWTRGMVIRKLSVRRTVSGLAILAVLCLLYNRSRISNRRPKLKRELIPHKFCDLGNESQADDLHYWGGHARGSAQSRVLVISTSSRTRASNIRDITDILASLRLKYKMVTSAKSLPDLSPSKGAPKYLVIVFQDIQDYYHMEARKRETLDNYCKQSKVGILAFVPSGVDKVTDVDVADKSNNQSSLFSVTSQLTLSEAVTKNHEMLRMIKQNNSIRETRSFANWLKFWCLSSRCVPVVSGVFSDGSEGPIVVEDKDRHIPKILIGGSHVLHFWFIKLMLIDALQYLTRGEVSFPLTRYVLVDIDDIFVGAARLVPSDVQAMVESQEEMTRLVTGFQYNLGFSGKYFKNSGDEENAGDEAMVAAASKFWWFPHMWKHIQPHRFDNVSELIKRMQLNKQFAESHGLPVLNQYSVAPHHSGVYPVHAQLYQAWRQVWDIAFTSTEEYPNLRPAHRRRGFIHDDIHVLPRQTCGLFTKNLHYDEYPNGPRRLEDSIQGGELFSTVLTNPISIFMTHMPNYCCDRLAPYTFQSLFSFIKCHTNINLMTHPPPQLANTYFKLFPDERQPVWGNPCDDKRHLEIWSESKNCQKLPNFLVVGPQKTGTTALFSFLQLHPSLQSSFPSKETFEEVQFFNGKNYQRGIEWYMDHFPAPNTTVTLFEKSATYFDGDSVPLRVSRLLPDTAIVMVLIPPGARAYSWYQHMRAHSDPTASNMSFREVLSAVSSSPRAALSLQSRCLEPGKYASHIDKWLAHFPASRLVIVDGEQLKTDPVTVMNDLQHSLQISPFLDYSRSLLFDEVKGFYCMKINGKKKCLGKGKGRVYPPMDEFSAKWLEKYYRKQNENLERLLKRFGFKVPSWLTSELSEG